MTERREKKGREYNNEDQGSENKKIEWKKRKKEARPPRQKERGEK